MCIKLNHQNNGLKLVLKAIRNTYLFDRIIKKNQLSATFERKFTCQKNMFYVIRRTTRQGDRCESAVCIQ